MSFFEDIASALDAEGIESRVNDDVMFVPITSDLEIQLVEIDPILPAANVYIAAADVMKMMKTLRPCWSRWPSPWMMQLRLWQSTSLPIR